MVAKFVGNIRRDDFRLRTNYPYLKTRIFYTGEFNYFIFIENLNDFPFLNFDNLKHEFDNAIKMMGNPVSLINEIPKNYIEEYAPIQDDKISENFEGAFFTSPMLINFLKAKYNSYKIVDVSTDFTNKNFVVGLDYVKEQEKNNLQHELDKLGLPFTFIIERKDYKEFSSEKDIDFGNPILNAIAKQDNIMQIPAYSMQPIKLDFIKRDESLWFDNIDKIYSGEFTKDNLNFLDKDKTSCFLDYTAASNIDIRNVLLMYDTIYITLPIKDKNELLFNKSFTKENLFYLIEKNRLKIINIQPEERLNTDILKEAYQIKPNSVVNRRALSLLSVADLYEINKNSVFNDIEVQNSLYEIAQKLSKKYNFEIKEVMDFINWPKQALRESFERFNTNGTWAYGYIGVNKILESSFNKILKRDLSLEFTMTAQNIHLANALGATLFPSFIYDKNGNPQSFEGPYANVVGNLLNFYKYANKQTLNSFNDIEDFKLNKEPLIYPIEIFGVDTLIPIEEFEQYTSSSAIRNGLNVLFNRLANIPIEKRQKEIETYNNKIIEYQSINKRKLLLSEGINDIIGGVIPSILSGNIIPLIIFGIFNSNVFKGIISRSDFFKEVEHSVNDLNNYIDAKQGKLSDIDILSQISRVAKLR